MVINEAQEAKLLQERAARNKQDRKIPFLINIKDGRLVPNVPALAGRPATVDPHTGRSIPARAGNPNYRPFTGSIKASKEERMKWIETNGSSFVAPQQRQVILSEVEPFDIGTATVGELIAFAKSEYNAELSAEGGLKVLRHKVGELARAAGAVRTPEESLG